MVYLILIFGFVLRLIALNQSLWLDEAIGAIVVRDLSLKEIFTSFLPVDNHPPLYYLILKAWTWLFGYSEISLRMPSVILGVATIYLTYLICVKITNNKRIALVAALLLSTSQFNIYYSQEARMYSMATFLAALAILSFLQIIGNTKKNKYWVFFSLSITLMVFTDYMPVFLLPIFFIYGFIRKKEKIWWTKLIMSFLPILVFGILWLPVFIKQLAGGKWLMETVPTWNSVAGGANIRQLLLVWTKFSLGRITLTNKTLYYFLIVLTSIPFSIIFFRSLKSIRKHLLIFLWLSLPLGLSFVISSYIPVFIYFRFLYIVPAFYLILAIGIENFKNLRIATIFFTILILINIGSFVFYISDPSQKREQWREAVSYVENRVGKNEIIIFSYPEPFAPYRWYGTKLDKSFGATDSIYANKLNTTEKTRNLLTGVKGVYYFEYLKDISDPASIVPLTLRENGFEEKEKIGIFNGVGFIYFFER